MTDPRSTRRWRTVSKAFIAAAGSDAACVVCGTEENLTVDHIMPYSKYPELMWEPDNWQIMCMTHNTQKSDKTSGQVTDYINPRWLAWEKTKETL